MTLSQQIGKIIDEKLRAMKLDASKTTAVSGDNWSDGTQKVKALNGLSGAVTIQAGLNISISIEGQTITVTGNPAENGIPPGGTTNQLLAKNSDDDFDEKWVDAPEATNGLPPGGSTGQVLAKDSAADYDTKWIEAPSGGGRYTNPIDEPPAIPSEWDDEFEGTVLNPRWSWLNQNSTIAVVHKKLHLSDPGTNGFSAVIQPAPVGDFIMTAKHDTFSRYSNYYGGGIIVYDSVSDREVYFINQHRTGVSAGNYASTFLSAYRVTPSTNTSTSATIGYTPHRPAQYLRARVVSGVIYFQGSIDGVNWLTVYTENINTYLSSITHIGVGAYKVGSAEVVNCFEWFRVEEL